MRLIIRAATVAAATLCVAATAVVAGPSLATDVQAAPVVPAYVVHAAANLSGSTVALNTVGTSDPSTSEANFATPVVEHALATVDMTSDEADQADEAEHRSLSEMVDDYATSAVEDEEHRCLAGAVYFESKGEPLQGQLAVAEVIINRSESGKFPSSLCGVVKQHGQFSFVHGGRLPAIPTSSAAWREAVAIAHIAQEDLAESKAPNALFFHARRVSPHWKGLKRVATVGNHIFYR